MAQFLTTLSEARDLAEAFQIAESRGPHASEEVQDHLYRDFRSLTRDERRNVSIRALYEACHGSSIERNRARNRPVLLSEEAVTTDAFKNIVGNLAFSEIMQELESPAYIARDLVTVRSARSMYQQFLPGIGKIGHKIRKVKENQSYPRVGLADYFVTMPRLEKEGFIIEFTEEVIQEDNTGALLDRARSGAESLAISFEREVLATALGVTTSYSRNGAAPIATYGDAGGRGFDNLAASNPLNGWGAVDTTIALFDGITDPSTGQPVGMPSNMTILVPAALRQTAYNYLMASGIELGAPGSTSATTITLSVNPLSSNARGQSFSLASNQFVSIVASSTTSWWIGDFKKAFVYNELWPAQMEEVTPTEAKLDRDTVVAFKFRQFGGPAVIEPRYVIQCNA